MTEVEKFLVQLDLDIHGVDGVEAITKRLADVEKVGTLAGKSIEFIRQAQERLLQKRFSDPAGARGLNQAGNAYLDEYLRKQEAARKRDEESQANAQYRQFRQQQVHMQKMAGIANPFAFITAKSGIKVQTLFNNVAKVAPQIQSLGLAFSTIKGVWDFAESIGELNKQLLHLGYTSGLGAQKLGDLGSAVAAFGGSAESIASGNEKFVRQIERMKRGGGLGYLGEVAYKYGFSVDMSADWETNNNAAIAFARTMTNVNERIAFLKDWDSANFTANMMKASMSAEQVGEIDAFHKGYDELGDRQLITEETLKYNIEAEKAKRSWEAITNQLAAMLLPLMTSLMKIVTAFTDTLAKSPGILKVIATLLGGIAGTMALVVSRGALSLLQGRKKIIQRIAQLALEKKITMQKFMQLMFGGPLGWIAAAAGIGMLAAGGMAMASGVGGGNGGAPLQSVTEEGVSVKDLVSGKASLTDREKYRIQTQEEMVSRDNTRRSFDTLAESAGALGEALNKVSSNAKKTAESIESVSQTAMTTEQYEKMITTNSNVDHSVHVASKNSSSEVNVNVNQNFNGSDTQEIREGTFDAAITIKQEVEQAAKRFSA